MAYLETTLFAEDLPADASVVALSSDGAVSRLFAITVDFETSDPDVDLQALLGKPVAVSIEGADMAAPLLLHGQIEGAEYVDARSQQHHYRVVLAPLIQALAHRVRSRIFQDKNVIDVVAAVFKDAGIPSDRVNWGGVAGTYPKREFCVQYQESELAFVMRLLEEEGIYFWFEHTEESHILYLADDSTAQPPIDGEPAIAATPELHAESESVTELVLVRRVTSDDYLARDWDFMKPDKPGEADAPLVGEPTLRFYEYPGTFHAPTDGERLAGVRAQEVGIGARLLRGTSNSTRLIAGRGMLVSDSTYAPFDGPYILTSVRHRFRGPFFGSEGDNTTHFAVTFEAVPAGPDDLVLRPARVTPKPRVYGTETAVVTGPPGEEIHVDEFGRVKVHFFWDREGKINDLASCWIRVQQQNTSGSMLLPRVGWELSVAFLDGDPDRPVAMQKLYNLETMPPYGMPANKTQSALQSSTSPGGGATNEVRLQDGAGGMEFFIHSSKDFQMYAGNDASEDITVNAHEEIGLELNTNVGADETVKVGAAQKLTVTGDHMDTTAGSKSVTVGAMDDWGVTGKFSLTADGNRTDTIGGMMNVLANTVDEVYNASYQRSVGAVASFNTAAALIETVNGSKTETVGGAKMELVRKAKSENVKTSKTLTCGLMTEKTGKDIGMSAKATVTITVGGPMVEKIDDAFTLGAAAITIAAAGGAEIKVGGSKLTAKGSKITVDASSFGGAGGPKLKLKGRINYKG